MIGARPEAAGSPRPTWDMANASRDHTETRFLWGEGVGNAGTDEDFRHHERK